jgi:hypothetical protein
LINAPVTIQASATSICTGQWIETISGAMALDHYVSQVHLKRFYSLALNGQMYAIRKSDLKRFTPNARSVCRIEEGNTNEYLIEPRAIEEFLKTVEGRYTDAVSTCGRASQ